jgi:hypothetical protein
MWSPEPKKPVRAIISEFLLHLLMFDLTTFPYPDKDGFLYLLLVVDHFTKYSWAVPVPDKEVTTIVDYLYDLFTLFDVPVPIRFHCDNEGEFINWAMTTVCEKLGVKQSTSLPRNPQRQGLVEERRKVEQKTLERGWKLSRSKKHTMEWVPIVHEIIRNENDVPCKTYNTLTPYFVYHKRPRDVADHQPYNSVSIAEMDLFMYER